MGSERTVVQYLGMGLNNLIKHGNNSSAIVFADFLHISIKPLSFVFIQFCSGFFKVHS